MRRPVVAFAAGLTCQPGRTAFSGSPETQRPTSQTRPGKGEASSPVIDGDKSPAESGDESRTPKSGGRCLPLEDDNSSVAFWYQTEPNGKFPALPGREVMDVK